MDQNLQWETRKVKVKDLVQLEINPRKISDAMKQKLADSLAKFNLVEIPAVNTDMKIIGGNQRVMALLMADRGEEEIDVRYPNRKLTSKEVKEYAIISNTHAGEFDFEVLQLEFADIDITEWGICESTNEEQNNNKGKIKKDTSNMIAIVLTDDEHSQWLNTKEQIGKMQDKNAIFELIKFYNEKNIN